MAEASRHGSSCQPFRNDLGTEATLDSPFMASRPGYDKLAMPAPVFIGETIRVESDVRELKERGARVQTRVWSRFSTERSIREVKSYAGACEPLTARRAAPSPRLAAD